VVKNTGAIIDVWLAVHIGRRK